MRASPGAPGSRVPCPRVANRSKPRRIPSVNGPNDGGIFARFRSEVGGYIDGVGEVQQTGGGASTCEPRLGLFSEGLTAVGQKNWSPKSQIGAPNSSINGARPGSVGRCHGARLPSTSAAISTTSTLTIESVRTSVPRDLPSRAEIAGKTCSTNGLVFVPTLQLRIKRVSRFRRRILSSHA